MIGLWWDSNLLFFFLLQQGVERLRKKAEESQAEKSTAGDSKERAQLFANRYVNFLTELSVRPSGRGLLTVRSILEAQQRLLREFGFPDAFCVQKKVIVRANLMRLFYFFAFGFENVSKWIKRMPNDGSWCHFFPVFSFLSQDLSVTVCVDVTCRSLGLPPPLTDHLDGTRNQGAKGFKQKTVFIRFRRVVCLTGG